jgi:hypothetical protein
MPNMDIFVAVVATAGRNSDVNVLVTFSGIEPERCTAKHGYQPKIDRNIPGQTLLVLWKRKMHDTKEKWRTIIEALYDEEEECKQEDQLGEEGVLPCAQGRQVNFQLKPWTKENTQRKFSKRHSPSEGLSPTGGASGSGSRTSSEASSAGQLGIRTSDRAGEPYQSRNRPAGTKKVAIRLKIDHETCALSIMPRIPSDELHRQLEVALKRNVGGSWLPRVVSGLGTEARYQEGDEVAIFHARTNASRRSIRRGPRPHMSSRNHIRLQKPRSRKDEKCLAS